MRPEKAKKKRCRRKRRVINRGGQSERGKKKRERERK